MRAYLTRTHDRCRLLWGVREVDPLDIVRRLRWLRQDFLPRRRVFFIFACFARLDPDGAGAIAADDVARVRGGVGGMRLSEGSPRGD